MHIYVICHFISYRKYAIFLSFFSLSYHTAQSVFLCCHCMTHAHAHQICGLPLHMMQWQHSLKNSSEKAWKKYTVGEKSVCSQ